MSFGAFAISTTFYLENDWSQSKTEKKIWASGVSISCIQDIFDSYMFKDILRSFCAFPILDITLLLGINLTWSYLVNGKQSVQASEPLVISGYVVPIADSDN